MEAIYWGYGIITVPLSARVSELDVQPLWSPMFWSFTAKTLSPFPASKNSLAHISEPRVRLQKDGKLQLGRVFDSFFLGMEWFFSLLSLDAYRIAKLSWMIIYFDESLVGTQCLLSQAGLLSLGYYLSSWCIRAWECTVNSTRTVSTGAHMHKYSFNDTIQESLEGFSTLQCQCGELTGFQISLNHPPKWYLSPSPKLWADFIEAGPGGTNMI